MLRVTQFSDTHFSTSDERSHGGFGYNTDETWDALFPHAFASPNPPDLVVVTGDIADRGRVDEYVKAASKLGRIPVPANVCAGNHDFQLPFESVLPRPQLTMSRTLRVADWLFVFADSNFAGREVGPDGRSRDREDRIHQNGRFGVDEMAWIVETIAGSDAPHAFMWVHHPPYSTGTFKSPAYDREMEELFAAAPKLRGGGAGHVHTDAKRVVGDRPVYICPAFTINIDFDARTLLPPGYRTYEFGDDGSVSSTCHLLDDERWPRHRLPRPALQWLSGEISYDEMTSQLKLR